MSFDKFPLGELCEILDTRRKPITKSNRIKGEYPYYGATGIVDYVRDYIFDEKLVLIGEDGAKWDSGEKTAFIADGKYWVNNHAHVVKPKRKIILDEWMVYFFFYKDLNEFVTGVTVPKLNQEKLKSILIPLPPLPIQQKIVAKLDKIFAEIDKAITVAEANIMNTEVLFQNYIKNIFSNINFNEKKFKLEEIAEITSSKRIMKHEYVSDGIPFYRSKEIKELANNKNITKKLFIKDKRYEEIKVKFGVPKKGEILVTAIGTIGEIYLIDNDNKFYFKDGNVIWIKNISVADPEYLKFSLISFVKNLNEISQGAAYSALPIHKLKSYDIFIPNIEMQKKIIKKIYNMKFKSNKLNEIYLFKIKEFFALKKSILQQAFSNELVKAA